MNKKVKFQQMKIQLMNYIHLKKLSLGMSCFILVLSIISGCKTNNYCPRLLELDTLIKSEFYNKKIYYTKSIKKAIKTGVKYQYVYLDLRWNKPKGFPTQIFQINNLRVLDLGAKENWDCSPYLQGLTLGVISFLTH